MTFTKTNRILKSLPRRALACVMILVFIGTAFNIQPRTAHASMALVQDFSAVISSGSSITASPGSTYTVGDVLVVSVSLSAGSSIATGISGGGVTTWTEQADQADAVNIWRHQIWTGTITTANTASVTAALNYSISGSGFIQVAEFSGVTETGASSSCSQSTGGWISTGSVTPTSGAPALLIVGFSAQNNGADSSAGGYSTFASGFSTGLYGAQYSIVSSASGSYSATWVANSFPRNSACILSLASGSSVTTTLGNGTDPSNASLAPGGAATMADAFTLVDSTSTDSVTAATVTLGSGAHSGIGLVEITSDSGSTVYGTAANPSSDTVPITLTTPISVTTSSTQYKIRITPLSHGSMPAPPGATYSATPKISAITSSNIFTGSDSASATITIDNASPGTVTSALASAGGGQNSLTWTNPTDTDYSQTIVLEATSTIGVVPVEGTSYSIGNTLAQGGYNGFLYKRSITVDHTKVPNTDQSNFPVLISGTYSYLETVANGGKVQNSFGYDIGFYSDSGCSTKLNWETEKYVPTSGESDYWVKIPTLSHTSDTVIYLCYGNGSITTDQSSPASVYDSNYKSVLHMNDNSGNTTIAASVGSNGANAANTSSKSTAGEFATALSYNGSTDFSSVAANLSSANLATVSFWMYWNAFSSDDALATEFTASGNSNPGSYIVDPDAGSAFEVGSANYSSGAFYWHDSHTRPTAAAWHYYTYVFDRSGPSNTAYIDGNAVTLSTAIHSMAGGSNFANSTAYLMSRAGSSLFATGKMQEYRISTASRSADWVKTEYNNQSAPSSFYTVGSETTSSQNVTVVCATSSTSCNDTGLTVGTAYYYKIFTVDTNGNYSTGVTPSGSPATVLTLPVVTIDHYRWRADNGSESSATYLANEDTAYTQSAMGDRLRLRFLVENTGSSTASNFNYLLEQSSSTNSWMPVPTYGNAGNSHWVMDLTSNYADKSPTTDSTGLTDPAGGGGGGGNGFSAYRTITIDHTKVPNTDQSNFPVLISGTYSYLATVANGGKVQNGSGYDVEFFTSNDCSTGKLNWETDTYNASTGAVSYWVKIATLSHTSDTVIYMCYGNSSVTTDQSSKTSTWSSQYLYVFHGGDGSSLNLNDSTSNAITGTNHGTSAGSGQIGGGISFTAASTNYFTIGPISGVRDVKPFTYTTWIKGNTGFNGTLYNSVGASQNSSGIAVYAASTGAQMNAQDSVAIGGSNVAISANTWHYLAVNYDISGNWKWYIDGSLTNSGTNNGTMNGVEPALMGFGVADDTHGLAYDGLMDEMHLENVALSPDWIATEYNNQFSPSTFYSMGSETNFSNYVPGYALSANDQTPNLTLATGQFTELEYSIRSTANVSRGTTYSFRLSNGGATSTFVYSVTPQASVTSAINVKNLGGGGSLQGGYIEQNATPDPLRSGGNEGGGGGTVDPGSGGGGSNGGGSSGGGGGDVGILWIDNPSTLSQDLLWAGVWKIVYNLFAMN